MRGIAASGLSAALAFSAISLLAWHTTDRDTEPAADSETVLIQGASEVSGWECLYDSSWGQSTGCSGEASGLPSGLELSVDSGVPYDGDASWPAEWPPSAATRLDDDVLGSSSHHPTHHPTHSPTASPTHRPTHKPTHHPTQSPTASPTATPTPTPTVAPTTPPTGGGSLPVTGAETMVLAVVAFAVVVIGAVLMAGNRRPARHRLK